MVAGGFSPPEERWHLRSSHHHRIGQFELEMGTIPAEEPGQIRDGKLRPLRATDRDDLLAWYNFTHLRGASVVPLFLCSCRRGPLVSEQRTLRLFTHR